jgi:hypothetical protein
MVWHQFLIHVRFGYEGDGMVQVWDNNVGSATPLAQYTGDVGYVPGQCVYIEGSASNGCLGNGSTPAPPDAAPTPSNKMTAYFGPYRPSDPNTVIMYITNVKFAADQNSANPSTP